MRTMRVLILAGLCLTAGGCLERQMTITSQPEGALVYVSDVEVGRTPVTVPFTWYGDYDVILRLDGYETLKTHAKIYPPIYEVPPLDLLSEMAPWTYRDRRYLNYTLHTAATPLDDVLIQQAENLRQENLRPVKH